MKTHYNRILIKVSGEAFSQKNQYGIDNSKIYSFAHEIEEIYKLGLEIGIVVGGGNIIRGNSMAETGIERATADYMGMLGTLLNALALQDALEKKGIYTRVMSALDIPEIAECYIRRRALRHLEKKRIIIFAGGTGNPYFTTDTAASLRAIEIGCDIILKATKVGGVYTDDPQKDKNSRRYSRLSFMELIKKELRVMDLTALTLCRSNNLPIIVFNVLEKGNLKNILVQEKIKMGTLISNSKEVEFCES